MTSNRNWLSRLTSIVSGDTSHGNTASAQSEWREKTLRYVELLNAFLERGNQEGWDHAGAEPQDPGRAHLAEQAMAAVRAANANGDLDSLRKNWPPAHAPLVPMLEENGQNIPVVSILDDGSIVARIGSSWEPGRTVHITEFEATVVPDVGFFGRSPERRYFGVARSNGIAILDGWLGPQVALCPWPTGLEGIPRGFDVAEWRDPPRPSRIVPFPDGRRVLMVSAEGIFVLSESSATRLLPTTDQLKGHFEYLQKEHPEDELWCDLAMEHGTVSRDGKFVAVGSQDSKHLVFDDRCKLIASIGNLSSYPHYAVFSADGSLVGFNSCHFYNGVTIGVPTDLLIGLDTPEYQEDERLPALEEISRVYAAVTRDDEIILGNAHGYLRSVSLAGELRWEQFIGSTIGDIDISPDGRNLVASTYAGLISVFDLDTDRQEPHQIGSGGHRERFRWLFWKNEPRPLRW